MIVSPAPVTGGVRRHRQEPTVAQQHIGLSHVGDGFSACGASLLSLSLSPFFPVFCLRPTPTHKSSSSAIKASGGQGEHVFFPAFTVFTSDRNVFPEPLASPVFPPRPVLLWSCTA